MCAEDPFSSVSHSPRSQPWYWRTCARLCIYPSDFVRSKKKSIAADLDQARYEMLQDEVKNGWWDGCTYLAALYWTGAGRIHLRHGINGVDSRWSFGCSGLVITLQSAVPIHGIEMDHIVVAAGRWSAAMHEKAWRRKQFPVSASSSMVWNGAVLPVKSWYRCRAIASSKYL